MSVPASHPGCADPLEFERVQWRRGVQRVAGVDEVGRGPLAGPVVAAAVILPLDCLIEGAADSKTVPAERREPLAVLIRARATCVGVGAASPREIDRLNILRATGLAMQRALAALRPRADHLLVDGLPVVELGLEQQTALVGGDRRCHSIACASLVAKVTRDRLMERLDPRYPGYGWIRNKGYGTPEHRHGLRALGPTPHHRRSFAPVQQLHLDATS